MAVCDVQKVLRRALFEPDFNSLMLCDPSSALSTYELSSRERSELSNPGPSLYAFTKADTQSLEEKLRADPSSFLTITVPDPPLVVLILVFVAAFRHDDFSSSLSTEVRGQLSSYALKIAAAHGAERGALVSELVGEITRGF